MPKEYRKSSHSAWTDMRGHLRVTSQRNRNSPRQMPRRGVCFWRTLIQAMRMRLRRQHSSVRVCGKGGRLSVSPTPLRFGVSEGRGSDKGGGGTPPDFGSAFRRLCWQRNRETLQITQFWLDVAVIFAQSYRQGGGGGARTHRHCTTKAGWAIEVGVRPEELKYDGNQNGACESPV